MVGKLADFVERYIWLLVLGVPERFEFLMIVRFLVCFYCCSEAITTGVGFNFIWGRVIRKTSRSSRNGLNLAPPGHFGATFGLLWANLILKLSQKKFKLWPLLGSKLWVRKCNILSNAEFVIWRHRSWRRFRRVDINYSVQDRQNGIKFMIVVANQGTTRKLVTEQLPC